MKKLLFLVFCCFLSLIIINSCISETDDSTVNDGHEHYAYCYLPNVCQECHATTSDGITITKILHGQYCGDPEGDDFYELGGHYADIQYDKDYCWRVCHYCGEIYDKAKHGTACYYFYCLKCGKTEDDGIILNKWHDWSCESIPGKNFDKNCHWWKCPDIYETVKREHSFPLYADGTRGTTCIYCDYDSSTNQIPADATGDGLIELDDVMLMIDYYCSTTTNIMADNCDVDGDGVVCDLPDIMLTIDIYCSSFI